MKRLNAGCGNGYKEGYVNLDILDNVKKDVKHNLNDFPYPFDNDVFDYILLDNVLEHLEAGLINIMDELHRISKNGATIEIEVPYYNSPNAHNDPTHIKFFTAYTFDWLTKEHECSYYSKCKFEIIEKSFTWTPLAKIIPTTRLRIRLSHYIGNLFTAMRVKLRVCK